MRKEDLYIDFDGVILDTIPILNYYLDKNNVAKGDSVEVINLFSKLNWDQIINNASEINNSIKCLKEIIDCNMFNSAILTHFISFDETVAKVKYIRAKLDDIKIILVPKLISKAIMVPPQNSILVDDFSPNLMEWESRGGTAIKFSTDPNKDSPWPVINRLDRLIELQQNKEINAPKYLTKK